MSHAVSHAAATAVYLCYWSLRDPLCQTQSLAYLRGLANRGHRFVLVTFEQPPHRLASAADVARMKRELASEGIIWRPLRYHGRPYVIGKVADFTMGVVATVRLAWRHRAPVIHARASIASAIGVTAAILVRRRFLYDADAPLSEEYVDHAYWRPGSPFARVIAWFERLSLRRAAAIVTLTERYGQELAGRRSLVPPMAVVPCCVDEARFVVDDTARARRRAELGVPADARMLVYVGKGGHRYGTAEMMRFVAAVRTRAGDVWLLVLTGEPAAGFLAAAQAAGLPSDRVIVRSSPSADVPEWLSAADAGLAFIAPTPCERAASPIKIGEYLASGLPVVLNAGIGDYSTVLGRAGLGVIVESASAAALAAAAETLTHIWMTGQPSRSAFAGWARDNLSLEKTGCVRYGELYAHILSPEP